MSRQAQARRPLFETQTPAEVWRQLLNLRCKCGAPGVMQVRVFLPLAEVMPGGAHEHIGAKQAMLNGGQLLPVVFRGPGGEPRQFIRALHAVGCRACRKDLELWAAKAPSYAVVEVDNGPPAIRPTVSVL